MAACSLVAACYSAAAEPVPAHYLVRVTCKGEGQGSWVKGSHYCPSVHDEEYAGVYGLVIYDLAAFFGCLTFVGHVTVDDGLAGCAASLDKTQLVAAGCNRVALVPETHVTPHDYHVTSGGDSVPGSNYHVSGDVHQPE